MNEEIHIPEEPVEFVPEYDLDGCIIIRGANGELVKPVLEGCFEPIVLTCIPSDAIFVETASIESVDDDILGGTENVLGGGFPVNFRFLGEDL